MHSREQYLAAIREEYLRGNKKQKSRLLNEARKRTKLNRKDPEIEPRASGPGKQAQAACAGNQIRSGAESAADQGLGVV